MDGWVRAGPWVWRAVSRWVGVMSGMRDVGTPAGLLDVANGDAASVLRGLSASADRMIATGGAIVPCEGRFLPRMAIIH
jgi:hypothetical protein